MATLFLFSLNMVQSQADLINATYSNSTHSVYQTNATYEFEEGTILCDTAYCSIHCDHEYACQYINISAHDAVSTNIQCAGKNGCKYMSASIDNVSSVTVSCAKYKSCYSLEVAINASSVQIDCGHKKSCQTGEMTIVADTVLITANHENALDSATIDGKQVDDGFVSLSHCV